MKKMLVKLQPFTDRNGKPRFRGVGANGEVVFASEAYSSASKRLHTLLRLLGATMVLDD